MRVDLARAMLSDDKLFVFDEFTSVVDREVAKIGSYAMQKAIRKTDKQFIAVTCHHDVEDWLLPDWIFDCDTMQFRKGVKKKRPDIKFEIYRTKDKAIWSMFAKHHYLSHSHNNAAHVYVAFINNVLAGFLSVLHLPHPSAKNIKKVHRLVVLPDYQGAGFGIRFLDEIGYIYKQDGFRYTIVTSAPSLIHALKKRNHWAMTNYGRKTKHKGGMLEHKKGANSAKRITASFELK